jgi:uncharacterized repeat protein (TIGR02543 family)
MKRNFKKFLSIILCAVMMISIFPICSSAADNGEIVSAIHGVSIEVGSDTATVQLSSAKEALLIVAIYDYSGSQLIGVGSADISEGTVRESVSVKISHTMESNATVKAFLIDKANYEPLCEKYDMDNDFGESYSITALSTDEDEITATISTGESCILYAEVLSEDEEKVLYSTSSAVEGLLMEQTCTLPLTDDFTFPDYYIVRAVLKNEEGGELSNPFTTKQYTSAYIEFEAMTPEDFSDDVVLDFGESGFGVLVENATVIDEIASVSDDNKYTFESGEDLNPNDIILVTDENSDKTPIKIKSVTDNADGTVTVESDDDVTISDLFHFLNLDANIDVGAAAENGGGAQLMSDVNQGNVDLIKVSGSITADRLTVTASATVELKVKSVYDKKLFGEDYFEFESYSEVNAKAKATVSGKVGSSNLKDAFGNPTPPEITLYKGPITLIGAGLAAIDLEVTIPLEFSFTAKGTAEVGFVSKSGFSYNPDDGMQPIKSHDVPTSEFHITGEFEIKAGPKIELKAVIAHGILEGSVSGQAGLKANGVIKSDLKNTSSQKYHACDACADITASAFFSFKGEITFKISEKIKGTLLSVDLLSGSWTLGKFYFSIKNDSDSYFEGKPAFGKGACPNYKYQITVNTTDKYGDEVTGVPVSVKADGKDIGSGLSPYKIYLYNGSYNAAADFDSGRFERDFDISGRVIIVTVAEKETLLNGCVTDALSGDAVSGANVSIVLDGGAVRSAVSNEQGVYTLVIPSGSYTLNVTASQYNNYTQSNVSVNPGVNTFDIEMKPVEFSVTFDANGGESGGGTASVAVGKTLNALPTASRKGYLFVGWNTSSNGSGEAFTSNTEVYDDIVVYAQWLKTEIPDDAVYFNGHSYKLYDNSITWTEAKAACEALGGHLATITTSEEQQFIVSILGFGSKRAYWLGATDAEQEGNWKWITGEDWSYTNWDSGNRQPDNDSDEDYLQIYNPPMLYSNAAAYKWNDQSNNNRNYSGLSVVGYICEWDNM